MPSFRAFGSPSNVTPNVVAGDDDEGHIDDDNSEDEYDRDSGSSDDGDDDLGNVDSEDFASGESSVDLSIVEELPDINTPEASKVSCAR
jgi:hypothetical protein